MAAASRPPRRAGVLRGRAAEVRALDRFVDAVRAGESRVLVLRGEPGVGKTMLLDHLAGHAAGCRIARASGVQSEMELAFAGLHQLCAPMLGRLARLPVPQREALETAFGLSAGSAPDRFLVGLAVLSLLSEVAGKRPMICLVDDQQWLDSASAQALGFVARRLAADPVGLVFAARDPGKELAALPELIVEGLQDDDARALLDSVLAGPLDARVRDRIVAETRGNPLALLELPRGLTPAELAGGFGLPGARPLAGHIEESFRGRSWLCRSRPGGCCSWQRPIRPATRCWYGERPGSRHPGPGGSACGGGGAGRVRRSGAVPASAGALGVLPVGVEPGETGRSTTRWPR